MRIGTMATTILVVDDEDAVRKSIAVALKRKRGFEVLEAGDGLVGLELAKRQKPDLIISDVIMDNLNGFMMLESLREDPETAQIPVIMMTTPALDAGAWKSGVATEYLEKGFSLDELLAVVDKVLKI
jgi:CheY-like chemotaxis protein